MEFPISVCLTDNNRSPINAPFWVKITGQTDGRTVGRIAALLDAPCSIQYPALWSHLIQPYRGKIIIIIPAVKEPVSLVRQDGK